MVDLVEFIRQLLDLLHRHAFNDTHGKSTRAEFIHHDVLSGYCLQSIGQVAQKVVINTRLEKADHRRNQQKRADQQNQYPAFRNPFTKFQFFSLPLYLVSQKA